jgi:histidinol dehydrogenase
VTLDLLEAETPATVRWRDLDPAARSLVMRRPNLDVQAGLDARVLQIIEDVRRDGDAALRAFTERFDGVRLDSFEVQQTEFEAAERLVEGDLRAAMTEARDRLLVWHKAGMVGEFQVETAPGVACGRLVRGIRRVGLYVPGGATPLPSTALMLGVPASLAGCEEIVMCTPPARNGAADPVTLVAARLCGITRVFKVGGAQAIAAMAFGTDSVPACFKLFGPGNAYVTSAKQQASAAQGGPAIDLPAGPSEVLVIGDDGASPGWIAADLLAQAEHGPDSQVVLLTNSAGLLSAVRESLAEQLKMLPRKDIAMRSLAHSRLVLVESLDEAVAISNDYAPEHLILAVREPQGLLDQVRSAGSVFLGDHAPESLGDYCSGTNHVLPTNGAAKAYSGLSVFSFQTAISIQTVSREGLATIGPCAVRLARAEGLEGHAQAVVRRLESLS